jgi:hypothetical protein
LRVDGEGRPLTVVVDTTALKGIYTSIHPFAGIPHNIMHPSTSTSSTTSADQAHRSEAFIACFNALDPEASISSGGGKQAKSGGRGGGAIQTLEELADGRVWCRVLHSV